jgi:hypothetical protein
MSPLASGRRGSAASIEYSLWRQMIRPPADTSAPSAIDTARHASCYARSG